MSRATNLLSGRLLAGNVIWSLAGAGLPLLVGLWAIPELIEGLGKERFGLLAIIWMGIGYFSLFDLGVGRALTKLVAERLGTDEDQELTELINVGLWLMWLLGTVVAVAAFVLSPVLIEQTLEITPDLEAEGKLSFWILSAVLPFVVNTAGLIGILQAHQRFRAISLVRLPLGIANFLGPVLVLSLTNSLVATTVVLAIARVGAWLAYYMLCRGHRASVNQEHLASKRLLVNKILAFGGWITVSNVIGPMMVYFDRLLIGSTLGLVAVTFYTTPYEIVTRLWMVPNAIADVLFPALTAGLVANVSKARKLYVNAIFAQGALMFPVVALLTLYAPELLGQWVGPEFAENSTALLRWLTLGVYINSFARLPFTLLQGNGRPDLTAKLHVCELPLYILGLWWLMQKWGIEGAAIAWTARIALDTLMLFVFAAWKVSGMTAEQYKSLLGIAVTSAILAAMWAVEMSSYKVSVLGAVLVLAVLFATALFRSISGRLPDTRMATINQR